MNVAIIPARGGSKRVPQKNIRPFHGRPIITYAIATAIESRLFDHVFVSTEDGEIAMVATKAGAELIPRPEHLADDETTTGRVMNHAVRYLIDNGMPAGHVCCLYAPTPLVTVEDLLHGHERLVMSGKCYAFSVAEFSPALQRALRMDKGGVIQPVWPQFNDVRSQDLEPRWRDAGQWYWGKADAWLNEVAVYGPWSVGVPVPRARAIDIDTEEDWALAEAMYFAARYPATARGEA